MTRSGRIFNTGDPVGRTHVDVNRRLERVECFVGIAGDELAFAQHGVIADRVDPPLLADLRRAAEFVAAEIGGGGEISLGGKLDRLVMRGGRDGTSALSLNRRKGDQDQKRRPEEAVRKLGKAAAETGKPQRLMLTKNASID